MKRKRGRREDDNARKEKRRLRRQLRRHISKKHEVEESILNMSKEEKKTGKETRK